jgi:uncharacterized protein
VTDLLPPLRGRLRGEAARQGAPIDLIERDYALGHVLATIYGRPQLKDTLIFKGGTALKKAYFGNYRFSVDLDFTAVGGPRGDELLDEVIEVGRATAERLAEYGPFEMLTDRRSESEAHPGGQEAFRLRLRFPWQSTPMCSMKMEITMDEPVLLPTTRRPLLHDYGESLPELLRCYSLEEVVAEKLRTMRQTLKRLEEGRWLRNCARDYYDLWRLCVGSDVSVDLTEVARILPEKLSVRDVDAQSPEDFFPSAVVEGARRQWGSSLENLVRPLPEFDAALQDLRASLEEGLTR